MITHATLKSMKSQYLQSSLINEYPIGSTLFCLVTFDLVLTEAEQTALFMAAVGDGLWRVGEMCVAEAVYESRPIAQRIFQRPTQAALFRLPECFPERLDVQPFDMRIAVDQLHKLLIALNPSWPCKAAADSLKLLSLMSGHWAAIEIAPAALFGVFHKAPFIPAHDLARLFHKQARAHCENPTLDAEHTRATRTADFQETDEILRTWADKDAPLGESPSRAVGCTKALNLYLARSDLNLAERMHAQLLIEDLSKTPPYRTLDTSTLPSYSNKYKCFFVLVREEDSCDLEPEHFLQAYQDMGGGDDMSESALPRWAMLHICAFLSRRGHWVPGSLTENPATKTPRPARIPVYTSKADIDQIGCDLAEYFRERGGTYAFARPRLNFERHATLRAAELRYSRPADFDLDHDLFHVTTSGHDHLKNPGSKGSIPLTRDISLSLADLKELRQEIDVGYDTLMFADVHLGASYKSFDEITSAIRKFTVARTGCLQFRRHDFRAAANTDACFPVELEIERLGSGVPVVQNCGAWTADELNQRFTRFAVAARYSRHASIATSLRFYNCSGPLDLHQQMELSTNKFAVGGKYASAVLGISAQELYVRKDRRIQRAPRANMT